MAALVVEFITVLTQTKPANQRNVGRHNYRSRAARSPQRPVDGRVPKDRLAEHTSQQGIDLRRALIRARENGGPPPRRRSGKVSQLSPPVGESRMAQDATIWPAMRSATAATSSALAATLSDVISSAWIMSLPAIAGLCKIFRNASRSERGLTAAKEEI
jgi:hypothetical protein